MAEDLLVRASLRDELTQPLQRVEGQVDRTRRAAERLGRSGRGAGEGLDRAARSTSKLNGFLRRGHAGVERLSTSLTSSLARGARIGALALGALATATVTMGLRAASNFQQARVAFDGFLGSAEAGAKMLTDLQELNKRTPFELSDLTQATRTLLGFGFAGEEVLPVLKSLTNAASGLGIGGEGLNRLILNLGQVRAAGKVTGRELRDFAVLGFPGYQIVADILGVTTQQVRELGDEAEVSGDQFVKAVMAQEGALARFAGQAQAQQRTLAGLFSNVKDLATVSLAAMSQPLVDRLSELMSEGGPIHKLLTGFIDTLGPPFIELATMIANGIVRVLPILEPLLAAITTVATELGDELTRQLLPVLPDLVGSFVEFSDALIPLLPDLVRIAVLLLPITARALELGAGIARTVAPAIEWLADTFGDLLGEAGPLNTIAGALLITILGYKAVAGVVGTVYAFAGAVKALAISMGLLQATSGAGVAGGVAKGVGIGALLAKLGTVAKGAAGGAVALGGSTAAFLAALAGVGATKELLEGPPGAPPGQEQQRLDAGITDEMMQRADRELFRAHQADKARLEAPGPTTRSSTASGSLTVNTGGAPLVNVERADSELDFDRALRQALERLEQNAKERS